MKYCYLVIFIFFSSISQAQIAFQENIIFDDSFGTENPYSVVYADIDNDGDLDVVANSTSTDYKLIWFENLDGLGDFGTQIIIDSPSFSNFNIHAADIDGDGDIDIITPTFNSIVWYENIDGLGNFGPKQTISDTSETRQVYATDIDNDGDLDLVSVSYYSSRQIEWYENTDGTGTFVAHLIDAFEGGLPNSVFPSDLDQDGYIDILIAGSLNDTPGSVYYYKNLDGLGNFSSRQMIDNYQINGAVEAYAADMDGDDDMDVIASGHANHKLVWYENRDGLGDFGPINIIYETPEAHAIFVEDIDGDGDIDLVAANSFYDWIVWHENIDGLGTFEEYEMINNHTENSYSVKVCDIDGDGDMDVLSASKDDDKIAWYENLNSLGDFGEQQMLTANMDGTTSLFVADFNGDNNLDVLSSSTVDGIIAWYDNTNGNGEFDEQQIIMNSENPSYFCYAADIDGDGDMDALATHWTSGSLGYISWFENTDGLGGFGPQQLITSNASGVKSIHVNDIDNDGDMDVISASGGGDRIEWYENTDGQGNFGSQQIISTIAFGASYVYSVDLDGDGDMDVISALEDDDKIVWHENINGLGDFGSQQIITTNTDAVSVYAEDIDGDGDLDVISASFDDNEVAWYENINGQGSFGAQNILSTNSEGAISVYAEDLDDDGDIDIVAASKNNNTIEWYENIDGQGIFGPQQIISDNANEPSFVFIKDFNGDGKKDVISASMANPGGKLTWFENLGNLSIDDFSNETITLLPNPANDLLFIESQNQIENIKIYSLQGQLILQKTTNRVNVSELQSGLYFVQVIIEGHSITKKFIKN